MRKIYALKILFALTSIYASAQVLPDKDPGEISIFLGGGFSSIHHQEAPRAGSFNGSAIEFGIGYTHYFNRNWGIFFGAGPGIYNTRKIVDLETLTPTLTDEHGYIFDLHTQSDYSESFQIKSVNVPVMIQYHTNPRSKTWQDNLKRFKGFYAMGGVKLGVPLNDTYETEITTITNAAYYPELDNWAATQRFAGLGTFDDVSLSDGELALDISLKLALEAGFKWRLGNNFLLYAGVFCDFGVHNPLEDTREPIRNHIAVDRLTDFALVTFSDKMDMTTAGIILRLAFCQHPRRLNCSYNPYKSANRRKTPNI